MSFPDNLVFVDSHCHLERLAKTPEVSLLEAKEASVPLVVTISVGADTLDFVAHAAQTFEGVYGSLGIHPHEAVEYDELVENRIRSLVSETSNVVAIGEAGLDYYYKHSEVEVQQQAFRSQLKLAESLGLPIVLHSRDAEEDTLRLIQENPVSKKGVAHSFTGSTETASVLLEMGWYIGVNGIISFKNAKNVQEMVRNVPLDRILLETDAPYLAPTPFRGKANAPVHIPIIAACLAELLDVSLEEVAEQTTQNAHQLFEI